LWYCMRIGRLNRSKKGQNKQTEKEVQEGGEWGAAVRSWDNLVGK